MLRSRDVAANHAHALGMVYVTKDGGQEYAM